MRLPGLKTPLRTRPEWRIGSPESGFEGVFAVLPGKILFSSFKGYAKTSDMRAALLVLDKILSTVSSLEDRSYARIADYTGLEGITWQARNEYLEGLRAVYKKHLTRPALTYLCGKKPLVLDLFKTGGEEALKGVATAETVEDAMASALGVVTEAKGKRGKEGKVTIDRSEIRRLVEFLSLSATDPLGMAEPRADLSDPLKPVYESIARLRSDVVQQNMVLALRYHELEKARAELKRKTDELTLLSDSIDTQIWYLETPDRYGAVNKAHADFIGLPKKSIEHRPVKEVVGEQNFGEWAAGNEKVFAEGEIFSTEAPIENAAGDKRHLVITKFPKLSPAGKVEYVVCQAADSTEAKQTLARLREASLAAEAATRAKREFFANMNHEIRTPLNGVIGVVEILSQMPATDEQERYIKILGIEARNMLELVNGILDFSKIDAGRMEIESIPFDLKALASELTASMSLKARNAGIELITDISPGLPPTVIGDPTRLRQALTNLIGNAIKFTHEGHVLLRMSPLGGKIRFEVCDTGVGIPEDKRDLVFREFAQVDGSTARRYGGTGLGGAIAKNLINLMGSEITLESREGIGTTISFELNLPSTSSEPEPRESPAEVKRLAGRALIVDDNETNLKVSGNLLERMGITATAASSGPEALEIFRPGFFDIVLMDIIMPRMDGFETALKMREAEKTAGGTRTPIVALSASKTPEQEEKAVIAGMDGFLTKPISQSELSNTLAAWLKITDPAARPAKAEAHPNPDAEPPVDLSQFTKELGDPGLAESIAREFTARLAGQTAKMRSCLLAGDWPQLLHIAHTLKGGAANIRAVRVASAARALEESAKARNQALFLENIDLFDAETSKLAEYMQKLR